MRKIKIEAIEVNFFLLWKILKFFAYLVFHQTLMSHFWSYPVLCRAQNDPNWTIVGRTIIALSSFPGKDWSDDEFDLEKKLLMEVETLRRPWWGRTRMLSSLWRSDFSADEPFAASQSFDSVKNAINITSKASFTPMTNVKYLENI